MIRLTATFKDIAGTLADPTDITFSWRDPISGATTSTTAVAKVSTGIYTYDLLTISPGDYYVRWEGDGALTAAQESVFQVKASRVTS